jgi:hypothetical protein
MRKKEAASFKLEAESRTCPTDSVGKQVKKKSIK